MLRIGFSRVFRQQAKLCDMLTQLGQLVFAVHQHAGKPAEVVQAEVVDLQLVAIDTQNCPHIAHRGHRHIADIQHPRVRAQTPHALRDDRCRVGIVHDPGFFMRVAIDQIDKLHHRQDRAQAVGKPSGSARFLAHHAVTQRDLLILLAHFILADAHLGEDEMRAAEGHFRIAGDGKFDALTVVANHLLDDGRNGVLTRLVDVIKADFGQREILQAHHQAFHNTRRVGAAAAGNRQNEWGCKHL